jgi:fimbrial isopeptide formation D2 family protein
MKKLLLLIMLSVMGSFAAHAVCSASFTYSTNSSPTIYFMNSSTGDSTGGGISYSWNFGDGGTDFTLNPAHTYSTLGSYNVCLHMMDNMGCQDSICQMINVQAATPTISVYFITDSMSSYACIAPDTVNFYYGASGSGFTPPDTTFEAHVVWGDGSDTTWTYTGNVGLQGTLTHTYLNAGTYVPQMTVSSVSGSATSTQTGMNVMVFATCGSVSGHVYNDMNSNCVFDMGEELSNVTVWIQTAGMMVGWTQSDASGLYSFNVPTGNTYTVYVQTNNGYLGAQIPTCPASGTLTVSTVPSTTNDFGLECPPGADITGSVTAWRFRPGFEGSVCVFAYNQSCISTTGQIELTLPADLTPLPDTAGIGYTINGQTVTYQITGASPAWSFCFPVMTSVTAQIGDTLCIALNIIAPGDSNLSNNTGSFCFPVRNSFDPNDKAVSPAGQGPQGAILPNTPLTYTIRFQNTGTDVAYNIYVLDTLDANLDVTTLEVIAMSHPMTYSVLAGNIIRFNFNNIMLADSNASEAASHGYVTYKISPMANAANGATIQNSASIYFDFNSPIYTNNTVNTIDYSLSVPVNVSLADFAVYPNPASNNFNIRFADNTVKKVTLTDALGKEVYHSTATDVLTITTSGFATGIYTIHVINGSDTQNRKLIVNH